MFDESGSDSFKRWLEDLSPSEYSMYKESKMQEERARTARFKANAEIAPHEESPWGNAR